MHGQQQSGMGRVLFDFLSQLGHVLVQGARGPFVAHSPDPLQQSVAVQDLAPPAAEQPQQSQLPRRKGMAALCLVQLQAPGIHAHVREGELLRLLGRGLPSARCRRKAARMRASNSPTPKGFTM